MSTNLKKLREDVQEAVAENCRLICDAYAPQIKRALEHRDDRTANALYRRMLNDLNRAMKPLWEYKSIYGVEPMIVIGEASEQDKAERRSPPITIWLGTAGEA